MAGTITIQKTVPNSIVNLLGTYEKDGRVFMNPDKRVIVRNGQERTLGNPYKLTDAPIELSKDDPLTPFFENHPQLTQGYFKIVDNEEFAIKSLEQMALVEQARGVFRKEVAHFADGQLHIADQNMLDTMAAVNSRIQHKSNAEKLQSALSFVESQPKRAIDMMGDKDRAKAEFLLVELEKMGILHKAGAIWKYGEIFLSRDDGTIQILKGEHKDREKNAHRAAILAEYEAKKAQQ